MAMLSLPSVTLLAIACDDPGPVLVSLDYTMQRVKFGRAVLLTNTTKYSPDFMEPRIPGLEVINLNESDKKVSVNRHKTIALDYEIDAIRKPVEFSQLGHVMCMEWDASVLNPGAWEKEFLDYDYIGAPWVNHNDPGWPTCNETNNVGNGGFCLMSALFCEKAFQAYEIFTGDEGMYVHDSWLCRTMRPWMMDKGVKYAPADLAARFSCENRIYLGEFGFHGKLTAAMNGWGGPWLGKIRGMYTPT